MRQRLLTGRSQTGPRLAQHRRRPLFPSAVFVVCLEDVVFYFVTHGCKQPKRCYGIKTKIATEKMPEHETSKTASANQRVASRCLWSRTTLDPFGGRLQLIGASGRPETARYSVQSPLVACWRVLEDDTEASSCSWLTKDGLNAEKGSPTGIN